jgi:hypothetical protein
MGIEESFARLSQLLAANQIRFYQDNKKLDAQMMERFKQLDDEFNDENENEGEGGDGNSTASDGDVAAGGGDTHQ